MRHGHEHYINLRLLNYLFELWVHRYKTRQSVLALKCCRFVVYGTRVCVVKDVWLSPASNNDVT